MLEKIKQILHLKKEEPFTNPEDEQRIFYQNLSNDVIRLDIGEDLVKLSDKISDTISELRNHFFDEYGFIFPTIHVTENNCIQENELFCEVRGKEVWHEFTVPNEETVLQDIENLMFYIFDNHLNEIFTYEMMEKYFDYLREKNYGLVYQLTCRLTVMQIRKILINLIQKKKSIKDLAFIFEKIADSVLSDNLYNDVNINKLSQELVNNL